MQLVYDSAVYISLREKNDVSPTLLKITIPSILVTGVKTPRALLSKEIVGKKLHIINPVIDIFYTKAGKDSARNIPTRDVYQQILGNLNMIQIDTLEITGAQISTRNLKTGKNPNQLLFAQQ